RTLADALHLQFSRIQFTPDLMPADLVGTNVVAETEEGRRFQFQQGPVFANIVLTDEINRSTPKTQSALLEAMAEQNVTVAGQTYPLPQPFLVMATQNPLEMEGTYPLPEAQLDRFMFNVVVQYPTASEELRILKQTTGSEKPTLTPVLTGRQIQALQEVVRKVPCAEYNFIYARDLVRATRPNEPEAPPFVKELVSWGAGPRAGQFLILGARARALLEGRFHVTTEDIRYVAKPVLRHRIMTTFQADSQGVTPDVVIDRLLKYVPVELHDQAKKKTGKA
ncbi:MAG: AAA family ATPase, partial [Planctomycetaceae bacterium]|nr:AAA family ATPase [Planctomycetaceae bacterium]